MTPTRSRQLLLLAGLAVVALLAVAMILATRDRPATDAPTATNTHSSEELHSTALTWDEAGGVKLPVSPVHGPRVRETGLASGFAESEQGAAIAAAHLLVRTGPTVGPEIYEPTITAQATGANVGALKLRVAEQHAELTSSGVDGQPAVLAGYVLRSFDAATGAATVDVILTAPDMPAAQPYLQVTVSLQWQAGDWRVVAPPQGDWAIVTTPLSREPAGLLSYEDT